VTQAIVARGTVAVPPETYGSASGVDGRRYSKCGIGLSLLVVPSARLVEEAAEPAGRVPLVVVEEAQ
jgi:hypothetical protein